MYKIKQGLISVREVGEGGGELSPSPNPSYFTMNGSLLKSITMVKMKRYILHVIVLRVIFIFWQSW